MSTKLKHYTHANIRKLSARDELSEGWYKFLVTSFERVEEELQPIKLRLPLSPLTDPGDLASKHRIGIKYNDLVLAPSETSGEVEGWKIMQAADQGLALLDKMPEPPYYNKDAKKWSWKGEEISSAVANEELANAREKALFALIEAYNDDSNEILNSIVGQKAMYGRVQRNEGKRENAGKFFTNLVEVRRELPEGAELVAAENFIRRDLGSEADNGEGPAPKKKGKKSR